MSKKQFFLYQKNNIPAPPTTGDLSDCLRWIICVMDKDDEAMGFVSGLLSFLCENGELTDRQSKSGSRVFQRIVRMYKTEILDCQVIPTRSPDLSIIDMEGEA